MPAHGVALVAPIRCDQAVFTCIRSPTSQGYRVIAASPGVRPNESAEVMKHAPSGDGLCEDSDDAVGVTYVRFKSGRHCVMHSQYAGKEPTGRGGRRTYTRVVFLDDSTYALFTNNPFSVVRAAATADALRVDVQREQKLPQLVLTANRECDALPLVRSTLSVGAGWLAFLVDRLLGKDNLVVRIVSAAIDVAEATLLALPWPARAGVAISAGVRFAPNRNNRLMTVTEEVDRTRQLLRGQAVCLHDAVTSGPPAEPAHDWAKAIQILLEHDRGADVVTWTTVDFTREDTPSLSGIGRLVLDTYAAETVPSPEAIQLAAQHAPSRESSPLQGKLQRGMMRQVERRVSQELLVAGRGGIEGIWTILSGLPQDGDDLCGFVDRLTEAALTRMSEIELLEAVRLVIHASAKSRLDLTRPRFAPMRQRLMWLVADWASRAKRPEALEAREVMKKWFTCFDKKDGDAIAARFAIDARLERLDELDAQAAGSPSTT
jgi:hypothetical protein